MRIGVVLSLFLWVAQAFGQTYPENPVRLIVPFSAGSAVDTLARIPAQKLSELWGHQVVVDNRVGANGIIGTEAAAKAPADGYTLVLANDAGLATSPALYPKLPYDPLRDLAPLGLAASIPAPLVANSPRPPALSRSPASPPARACAPPPRRASLRVVLVSTPSLPRGGGRGASTARTA